MGIILTLFKTIAKYIKNVLVIYLLKKKTEQDNNSERLSRQVLLDFNSDFINKKIQKYFNFELISIEFMYIQLCSKYL